MNAEHPNYGWLFSERGSRSNDVKNHAKKLIHCLY